MSTIFLADWGGHEHSSVRHGFSALGIVMHNPECFSRTSAIPEYNQHLENHMSYLFKGRLRGHVCGEHLEPLAKVKVRLYRSRADQNVTALAVASPKNAFAFLSEEDVRRKESSLLGEFETNDVGEFVAALGEQQGYQGEAFEVDVYCGTVPGRKPMPEPPRPVQFSIAALQPSWHTHGHDALASWGYCLPQGHWSLVRAKFDARVIRGRVMVSDTKVPVGAVKVSAFDVDWVEDDALGSAITDSSGEFRIDYASADFRKDVLGLNTELIGGPDLYFKVETASGDVLLVEPGSRGREPDRENVGHCVYVELRVKKAPVVPHALFTPVADSRPRSVSSSNSGAPIPLKAPAVSHILMAPHAFTANLSATAADLPNPTLTGFDMVWAITENTVNSQLSWLQDSGLIPNKVKIGDLDTDGIAIGGTGEDEATISAPTVDFDTGVPKQVKLIISFTGGNVSYYSGFGRNATVKKQPVAGWKLVFNVNLNIGQIGHDYLIAGKNIPPEILKILTQFDPSMFSVQSIFMDFENSDLTTYNTLESVIKTDEPFVQQNFATSVGAWITSHKGADNPFILGYPVTRQTPPADVPSIFEPTGANLSAHSYQYPPGSTDQSKNGLSTLNFLLVTGNRKITDDQSLYGQGAGIFHRNLVESNDIDGKGIIAHDVFFDKYLHQVLVVPFEQKANELQDYVHARDDRTPNIGICDRTGIDPNQPATSQRAKFVRTAAGWSYGDHVQLNWHESGFYSHDRESEQNLQYAITVSMQPDAAGAQRLTMDILGSLYRYEWDQQNEDIPPFQSNVYVGKGWASATITWNIRLQFIAGADGKITITKTSAQNDPVTDHGDSGLFKVADFFSDLLDLHGINDNFRDNAASLGQIEGAIVQQLLDQTGPILDNAMTRVVMPARSQFFYKNLLLNSDGDIEIDFTYKSEG
jgi:hypothetical protein